jgi:endonuclease-8
MPEGPSIVILKEAVKPFEGKKVIATGGNTRAINIKELVGKTVLEFKSWGKHFLICFPGFAIRVHFMLYGSYLVNQRKEISERLALCFNDGEINFYSCSVIRIDDPLDMIYDWSADVLSSSWDAKKAIQKLKKSPGATVCDALLNQDIFSGVGNIIKNEVLFRVYVHPESLIGCLPSPKLRDLVGEAVKYSWQFYEWKKQFLLRKNWLVYRQQVCPRNNVPLLRSKIGIHPRLTFYCPVCQRLYK